MIGGETLQIVHDTERAGGALVNLVVDDLSAEIDALTSRVLSPEAVVKERSSLR